MTEGESEDDRRGKADPSLRQTLRKTQGVLRTGALLRTSAALRQSSPPNRVRDCGAGARRWRHGMAGVRLLKTKAKKRRWIPDLVGNDRLGKKRE